jgi:hypothetical protein
MIILHSFFAECAEGCTKALVLWFRKETVRLNQVEWFCKPTVQMAGESVITVNVPSTKQYAYNYWVQGWLQSTGI